MILIQIPAVPWLDSVPISPYLTQLLLHRLRSVNPPPNFDHLNSSQASPANHQRSSVTRPLAPLGSNPLKRHSRPGKPELGHGGSGRPNLHEPRRHPPSPALDNAGRIIDCLRSAVSATRFRVPKLRIGLLSPPSTWIGLAVAHLLLRYRLGHRFSLGNTTFEGHRLDQIRSRGEIRA